MIDCDSDVVAAVICVSTVCLGTSRHACCDLCLHMFSIVFIVCLRACVKLSLRHVAPDPERLEDGRPHFTEGVWRGTSEAGAWIGAQHLGEEAAAVARLRSPVCYACSRRSLGM